MKKGFTLAEVLITLGIIGIVAALTIPTLIANFSKNPVRNRAKKSLFYLSQALEQMAVDGGTPGDLSSFFASADLKTIEGDKIVPYFNVAKNCAITTLGCFPDIMANNFDGTTFQAGGIQQIITGL